MNKNIHLLILFSLFGSLSQAQTYTPGQVYFGENDYIEYQAGNLPIIISAPHGGSLSPADIPDRSCEGCVYVTDAYTEELIRQINLAIIDSFGCYPHIIINRLKRTKLDANRAIGDAADGNAQAETAWYEFHDFIEIAQDSVEHNFGKGLYLDLHGHGHSIQRLELGYRVSKSNLQLPDSILNNTPYNEQNSIRNLTQANLNGLSFAELIRGTSSFGELYEKRQVPAVPSQTQPFPHTNESYFSGGYNTDRHGSKNGGKIDGIQIECNRTGIRDTYANRERFSFNTASVLLAFFKTHYFEQSTIENFCSPIFTTTIKPVGVVGLFEIIPNPALDVVVFKLKASKSDAFTVTIFNQFGCLKTMNMNETVSQIELSTMHYPPGMYYVRVESSRGFEVKKFMKM